MTLLDECLEALGENKVILLESETTSIFKSFSSRFPITRYGAINWDEISNKYYISKLNDITSIIESKKNDVGKEIFILWDEASLPCIKTDLDSVLNVIYDVTAVSFDTWLYSSQNNYVVEFNHNGKIVLGFL